MAKRRKQEWFDDDSFWQAMYPFMFPNKRFEDTAGQIEQVLNLTRPPGMNALDLCCGPGRCSVALAERGYFVTGVDRTEYLLKKARSRSRAAKKKIEWIRCDMRDFVRPESFDLALSMFTSFGYFDDKDDDLTVLSNILISLRPGGACLIDVMGKEVLAKIFHGTNSDKLPDGSTLMQRAEIFDNWTRVRNEWTLIRKGHARAYRFHHTIYSGQELIDRMLRAGFADVELFGNLEGDEYGPDSSRLIAVGRK
jgi:SAM-dependent methyltransferase